MNTKNTLYLLLLAAVCTLGAARPQAITDMPCKIYVPNVFSPNNDGINDTFQPALNCPVSTYDFKVFTRWGQQVFATQDSEIGWNGDINGRPAAAGVYIYTLKVSYESEEGANEEIKTGDVSLIR